MVMDSYIKKPRNNQRGFSLLELLTVLIIVGVLAGAVVMSYTSSSDRRTLHTHAERLMLAVELARQKSTLANEIWGFRVAGDAYEFVRLADSGDWSSVADSLFTNHAPGSDIEMSVRLLDGTKINRQGTSVNKTPHVLLLPSGETSAFEVRLTHIATRVERYVIGDGIQAAVVSDVPYTTIETDEDA